jgi:hypothetical protein
LLRLPLATGVGSATKRGVVTEGAMSKAEEFRQYAEEAVALGPANPRPNILTKYAAYYKTS